MKGQGLVYLKSQVDDISSKTLDSIIATSYMGKEICYLEEVDSTNEEAKRLARQGVKEGYMVIADKQVSGKGRLGRSWDSPSGTGIWMSLVLRPEISPDKASQITLIGGLAMCEAIRQVTHLDAKIKWPNDIVINGKKVCGILTEMNAKVNDINYIVIGVGVNVNSTNFSQELPFATSLKLESKMEYKRKDIIKVFLEKFEAYYIPYKTLPTLEYILPIYKAYCITLEEQVKIMDSTKEYIATPLDITLDGKLVIKTKNNQEQTIASGEVSVRGIYGYV